MAFRGRAGCDVPAAPVSHAPGPRGPRAPASRQSSADGREEERVKVSSAVEWRYDAAALVPRDKYLQILVKRHLLLAGGSGWRPLSRHRAREGDGGRVEALIC